MFSCFSQLKKNTTPRRKKLRGFLLKKNSVFFSKKKHTSTKLRAKTKRKKMLLEELNNYLGNRTHADLYLGKNKKKSVRSQEEEMTMKKLNEIDEQWKLQSKQEVAAPMNTEKDIATFINLSDSHIDNLNLEEIDQTTLSYLNEPLAHNNETQDFGEHKFNEVSLNILFSKGESENGLNEQTKNEIKEEPKTLLQETAKKEKNYSENNETKAFVVSPPPPPLLPLQQRKKQNRPFEIQDFLLNVKLWVEYESLFINVNVKLKAIHNHEINRNDFNIALKYIYSEALKSLDSTFFVNTSRENTFFRETVDEALSEYKNKLNDLLNQFTDSSKISERFREFVRSATDEKLFACGKPYFEKRTPKKTVCFVTNDEIKQGSEAYAFTLYKNDGETFKDYTRYVKCNTSGKTPTMFIDMAWGLITFTILRRLLIGKIFDYPNTGDVSKNTQVTTAQLAEVGEKKFNHFVNNIEELANLIVFQESAIAVARKCLNWVGI